jgi:uncharacterized membrane protein YeaQ/YmgE (transglycosylase-associated protein family)
MSIESLSGMFSQRSGVNQSMGNSIMNAIVGFLAQKMMGGEGGEVIGSMLSGIAGGDSSGSGLGGLNQDHELVRHVQQNAGIQDPEQARQYTQQGVDILNEQSNSNPQGLQSLFSGFLGGGGMGGIGL